MNSLKLLDLLKLFFITKITSQVILGNNVAPKGCSEGSECAPYYLCKNRTIITNGEGLIDIRIDETSSNQCGILEVCCALSEKSTKPVITPKPTSNGCGYRNVEGIGFRITDGKNEAQYAEFPWMVAITRKDTVLGQTIYVYRCGGSLIHPQVVLTAAHCVVGKASNTLKVKAGEWDLQTKDEPYSDQDREVTEIFVHPNHHKEALFNDIALLFLIQPFDLASNVKPVCLPPLGLQFDFQRCFATGWGKDAFGNAGKYQSILKKVELLIVPKYQCQSTLRTTDLGKYFELHSSFICAGGERGVDTCQGDGGSPLVCPIQGTNNRYYQAGIVAWGIGCGDEIPAVYANVAQLRNWVDQVLAQKNINSSVFTPIL